MNEEEKYQKAKQRVEEIKGFYIHLFMFILINCGLLTINLVFAPQHYWFYWPLFGWGIGLVAHGLAVFGLGGFLGKDWEEKKIKKIMDKME